MGIKIKCPSIGFYLIYRDEKHSVYYLRNVFKLKYSKLWNKFKVIYDAGNFETYLFIDAWRF